MSIILSRLIAEHLGLGARKPFIPNAYLANELRELAFQFDEKDATTAFLLNEAADRLSPPPEAN